MAGTKAGGKRAAATNKEKYGDDFYANIGRKGGKKCGAKGFALMDPEKRSAAGKKGGTISKRGPAKNKYTAPHIDEEDKKKGWVWPFSRKRK